MGSGPQKTPLNHQKVRLEHQKQGSRPQKSSLPGGGSAVDVSTTFHRKRRYAGAVGERVSRQNGMKKHFLTHTGENGKERGRHDLLCAYYYYYYYYYSTSQ
jgi:hypothetical protein